MDTNDGNKIVYLSNGGDDEDNNTENNVHDVSENKSQSGDSDVNDQSSNILQSDDEDGSETDGSENSMSTNGIISIHPLQLILSRFLTTDSNQNETKDTARTITHVLEDILSELKTLNKTMKR